MDGALALFFLKLSKSWNNLNSFLLHIELKISIIFFSESLDLQGNFKIGLGSMCHRWATRSCYNKSQLTSFYTRGLIKDVSIQFASCLNFADRLRVVKQSYDYAKLNMFIGLGPLTHFGDARRPIRMASEEKMTSYDAKEIFLVRLCRAALAW